MCVASRLGQSHSMQPGTARGEERKEKKDKERETEGMKAGGGVSDDKGLALREKGKKR